MLATEMSKGKNPHDVRVVITGLGTVNPIGNTVREFWDNLRIGKSGVRRITMVDVDNYHVKIAGELDLPDVAPYGLTAKSIRRYDRYIILSHIAATQAIRDAALDPGAAPERYGVIIGSGDGGSTTHEVNTEKMHRIGLGATSPLYLVNAIPNTAPGFVAMHHNLQGLNFSLSSACATGNHAIGLAGQLIRMGMADAILAGGTEAPINMLGMCTFGNIGALSERNDSPETASRPFDKDRDGFVLSEGSAVLCVEELEHARRRGARIYAELTGIGFSCDAYDLVAPHPEARGATQAMRSALAEARLSPDDIDLLNAHATSTPIGDLSECRAVHRVFGDRATSVMVQATKSMTGHCIAAASAIEAVASLMAIVEGVVHPTTNQFERDPQIDLNVVVEPRQAKVRHMLSDSFGFAGQNAAIILSAFEG
jgi:3-oxoacyl-[acyl-carrier-protein] synthase II